MTHTRFRLWTLNNFDKPANSRIVQLMDSSGERASMSTRATRPRLEPGANRFFSRLAFTAANEDGRTELAGLRLDSSDRVLCLAGSGARAFDLLLGDPGSVVALDVNPAQCRLVRLKMAAWRALSHAEMLAWLGVAPCDDRLSLFHQRIEPLLAPDDREWWRSRLATIRDGVWYAGLWERTLRGLAFSAALLRRGLIDDLFDCQTIATQESLWRNRWDRGLWPLALRLLGQPALWRVVGEPGGELLPPPAECERIIRARFHRATSSFLLRDSDFAWLMLRGRHSADALPLHLRPDNYETIRSRLDRVEVRLGSLGQLDPGDPFDAFSLSDFGSYTSAEDYATVWRSVLAAARPGARWCERVLFNPLSLPPGTSLDEPLSERLSREDRAIVYDIRAGTIG